MALNAPYTPNTVIQSTQVSNDLTGLANGSNDTSTNSMSTFRSEATFDFVVPGTGVWTGDSYGGSRNASMTAATLYIGGVRITISAITAHLFTASKDTYVDINNAGTVTYTEAANNAASPALAASSIRMVIVVTGASFINAAGSVNQGQETMILPIASSIAYSVTDSLGNMICPRDPNRRLLGYRQITSNATTTSTSLGDIVGLNSSIIVPANMTGRKLKITFKPGESVANTGGTINTTIAILEDGVQLDDSLTTDPSVNFAFQQPTGPNVRTPAAGSHTYKIQWKVNGSSTATLTCSATSPAAIIVELE